MNIRTGTEAEADWVIARWDLKEELAGEMRTAIEQGKVQQVSIRTALLRQGEKTRRAIYLLEGSVSLTATLANGQKAVIGQMIGRDMLALGAIFSRKGSEHTITAVSEMVSYIVLPEQESHVLAELSR